MYWLLSIDAVVRIGFALAFLFIIVPALARTRSRARTFLENFFWNLGVGIALITLVGQIFTLANLFTLVTILGAAVTVILIGRSIERGISPLKLVHDWVENAFLVLLNIFDGRVNVLRRMRRSYRRAIASLRERTRPPLVRLQIAAWSTLTLVAAALRFYRPMASANLGFSDTYVHLYLVKLLEEGRQVDPAWGPYPRGMHFLLMAVHELTNVDEILLMNFFGAFVGVLMTLAVADTVRRLAKSQIAGLIAGFLFATLVGGAGQYFVLGGAFATDDAPLARSLARLPYQDLTREQGEFDLALTAFHRQTSTLPQELAIVLLFPAAMFLYAYFTERDRWHLAGFGGCSAAIAAVHSGVAVPLILMSALMLVAVWSQRTLIRGTVWRSVLAGFVGTVVGSSWVLGFIAYPYAGGKGSTDAGTSVPGGALYYFPFLRRLAGGDQNAQILGFPVHVTLTPFLVLCIVIAVALAALAFTRTDDRRVRRLWTAAVFLLFLLIHFSSMLNLPQIVETTRNAQWLLMSIVVLLGVMAVDIAAVARTFDDPRVRRGVTAAGALILLGAWTARVPRLNNPEVHNRLVNYSGYGGAALAVLNIERSFEPYTWTIVSYGQEFPMVLRRGFALPAADFLDRYDPMVRTVPIPTPSVFVIVEKKAHQFQINNWSRRFSRSGLEQRLQTWVQLYQATHANLSTFYEDDDVRVYQIERSPGEIAALSRRAGS